MEALDNQCPSCGAKITFNPKNQMWDCEYCGSKYTLEQMKQYQNASREEAHIPIKEETQKIENMDVYRCKNCGAEIMADETTTATFCVYCGSTAILKDKIMDEFLPTKLIPFKKVKEDAITAFQGLSKGRPLMPKFFNKKENIDKISGVYIPFWSYDLHVNGDIDFHAEDVTTWSDSDYEYTKTDRYLVKRNGSMNFQRILVDGSSHFPDDLMDSLEPFDYRDFVDYNHAYLSGFFAEKYDVKEEDAIDRANKRAMNTAVEVIEETVHHQSSHVSSNQLQVGKQKSDYVLLPVFMVNVKYKEKIYTFAMNGQTGEIVGNIPLDMMKTILFSLSLFILFFILAYLFLTMVV